MKSRAEVEELKKDWYHKECDRIWRKKAELGLLVRHGPLYPSLGRQAAHA